MPTVLPVMKPNLQPLDPLSQVVFVHDYLQLVFQDEGFSIYNLAQLEHQGTCLLQGAAGFCDGLVGLIGQRVTDVSTTTGTVLTLTFEGGTRLSVLSGENGARGPEAFEFRGPNDLIVVDLNA